MSAGVSLAFTVINSILPHRSWVLEEPKSLKFSFIRETLEREIRLSYYDRIKGTIPDTYLDSESGVFPAVAPAYSFKYGPGFEIEGKGGFFLF